jgi:hypothetical protein
MFLFNFNPSFAGEIKSIPAPCLTSSDMKSPRLDLQSCNYMFSEKGTEKKKNFTKDLHENLKKQINCFYEGYLIKADGKTCSEGYSRSGSGPKKIACSINDAEDQKNHLSESCGSPDSLDQQWERTQFLGLWVQGVKFYRNQVIQEEIIKQRNLKIHPRCEAPAEHYMELTTEAKSISNTLTRANSEPYPPEIYNGTVDFCSADAKDLRVEIKLADGSIKTVDFNPIIPKASACYLSISRDNRVLMFSTIADCEVWARLDDFFVEFMGERSKQINQIISACAGPAADHGESVARETLSRSQGERAGIRYFKNCYRPKIKEFFKKVVDDLIPGKFDARNEAPWTHGSASFFLIGAMRFRLKRSKKKGKKFVAKIFFGLVANLMILYWGAELMLGCGGGGGGGSVPNIVTTCTGNSSDNSGKVTPTELDTKCCTPGENSQYAELKAGLESNQDLCRLCAPLTCIPMTETLPTTNTAGLNAHAANTAAQSLASAASAATDPTDLSPMLPNQSGATAESTSPSKANKRADSSGSNPLTRLKSRSSAGGGGGGAISGGFSGNHLFSADTQKTGNAGDSGQGSEAAASASTAEGTLTSGSGEAGGVGADSMRGLTGRGSSVSPGGGQTEQIELGAHSSEQALPIDDPIDYFTRVSLEESLFKVVHKRYESASLKWIQHHPEKTLK